MILFRRAFTKSLFASGSVGASCFGYGSLIEKSYLSVTRQEIPLQKRFSSVNGLKIGVMGDFHHDDFGDDALIRRAVDILNAEPVDIVMLVGDYISSDERSLAPLCSQLRHLKPKIGTFAVPGNHDRWHLKAQFPKFLRDAGIKLLSNEIVENAGFAIAGLDSMWGGTPDLAGILEKCPSEKPIILGWHEPDTFNLFKDERIVLQLSGHTHGGQICAPLVGPILLPRFGKIYPYGHYRKDRSSLFVTRGIGTLNIPARFLCPPEVAILTLKEK